MWEKGRQLKSYDGITYTYDAWGKCTVTATSSYAEVANAATRAFTVSKIQRWIESILDFSIGYGIAWIIDHFDGDGKSGYIRF